MRGGLPGRQPVPARLVLRRSEHALRGGLPGDTRLSARRGVRRPRQLPRRLDLGAVDADPGFMDGWTEDVRPSYRCGRILDRVVYEELVAAAGAADRLAFPAYRTPAARLER